MHSPEIMPTEPASLLSLPAEIRNAIYLYVFDPNLEASCPIPPSKPNPLALSLQLQDFHSYITARHDANRAVRELGILRTCKRIYVEAQLLALSFTPFHLSGDCTYPDVFDLRSRALSAAKIGAIRHLTLTARISHLRALNEAWAGTPFGHPSLRLDTLTIIPKRPEVFATAFAEIADLSQSHTLAYIFSETLKGLRNVKCIEVRNEGCFNETVWRQFYRALVYRLWRWGGGKCGVRFESGDTAPGGTAEKANHWFRAYFTEDQGIECGEEVVRLVGLTGEFPDPNLAGVGP
ncbi:hypothetical protein TI39_contig4513g00002 [Zymoseptoria brevis]|uniref:Uncharacterized protein n=1 Tax=Zymoseptoria brevis TaxID=1047168 RepID=A0A0F4G6G2_9PEZI|nr:hypothetical protein TI39_contig4513g00002 [Zymoseptoria brevis]